ncbi:MAG: sigma-70 family RNA polymerase sigma factor [Paraglaciecola sp.]|nr:sigma-70 family RNA polymerase sigma factor [Paraglaciecola sp.]NCT48830.1 sigma-70 family RNA polymerase sigma factor [Paraglaciecola sp.]
MHTKEVEKVENSPQALVQRIANGDKSAEKQLVSTYYRGLFFILNRQTSNPTLSEDLTQDTFILVIQKARLGEILNPAALNGFIRQVGINLLIAHFRKESRRATHSVDDIDIHIPDAELDISRALHSEKILAVVQQVISELPTDRDRDLLRRFFVYDKPKAQICEELCLSAEHFDRVLFRARQRLKQVIELKLSTGSGSTPTDFSHLLTIVLLLSAVQVGSSPSPIFSNLFLHVLRESPVAKHLIETTPEPSSRLVAIEAANIDGIQGKQFSPESRCV